MAQFVLGRRQGTLRSPIGFNESQIEMGAGRTVPSDELARLSDFDFRRRACYLVPVQTTGAELEREILKSPDDEQRYVAYGEWLREQGDPRGEFCEVQAWLLKAEREHEARVAESENAQWAIDLAKDLDEPIGSILHAEWPSPLDRRLRQWEEDVYARGRRTREIVLWDAHNSEWLAGLEREQKEARLQISRSSYRLGFLDRATIQDSRGATETFNKLRKHRAALFVRALDIAAPSYQSIVAALVRDPPPALRELLLRHLCDSRRPCTLALLYGRVPALKKLGVVLHSGPTDLGSIVLPELLSFSLAAATPLQRANLRSVTTAHWPKLKRLSLDFAASNAWLVPFPPQSLLSMARAFSEYLLFCFSPDSRQHRIPVRFWLGETVWRLQQAFTRIFASARHVDPEAGSPCTLEDLTPLLDAQGLAELVWLELSATPSPDRLPEALAQANVLKQLLVLKFGVMSEAGARALLEHARAFRHLKLLELHFDVISPKLVKELEAICDQVRVYRQTSDGWRRAASESRAAPSPSA